MRIVSSEEFLEKLSKRQADLEGYEAAVLPIIERVKEQGDSAVLDFTCIYDGKDSVPHSIKATEKETQTALATVDLDLLRALKEAHVRIKDYHQRQKEGLNSYSYIKEDGSIFGYHLHPFSKAGIYVPGGQASYPSSVLMGAVPAKIAGVKDVIVCTPPRPKGKVHPSILVAAHIAEVSAVYKVGGAQAVAAMAYGTRTIPKVEKIVGPGNVYVTAAKKAVFGIVNIDSLAGPSEIAIIADENANSRFIASDLLAQAEHDVSAWSILVTWSPNLGQKVLAELNFQLLSTPRKKIAEKSLSENGFIVSVKNMEEAFKIVNLYAPEHLEVMVKGKDASLNELKAMVEALPNCGGIFFGDYSPVAAGDYGAGPNHILPTGGSARCFSGLTVADFLKSTTYFQNSREGLMSMKNTATRLAREEGFWAHLHSIDVRFQGKGDFHGKND